ncbi:MAG TPA: hypothetical protein VFN97_14285 [Actinospica sp.]|nr:hypothetical protein [Actinospica sp.]
MRSVASWSAACSWGPNSIVGDEAWRSGSGTSTRERSRISR